MNRLSIKKIIGLGIIGLCLAFYLYSLFLKNGLLHGMILLMLGVSVGAILVLAFSFILPSDKKESEELSPEEQLNSTVNLINKLGGDIRKEGDRYTMEYQTRKVEENERTKQERISFIELYKQRLRGMEYEAHNQYVPENHNQYIPDGDYSSLKGYDPDKDSSYPKIRVYYATDFGGQTKVVELSELLSVMKNYKILSLNWE